jgi:ribosome-binding protein aMBF1 (putative translation factor)
MVEGPSTPVPQHPQHPDTGVPAVAERPAAGRDALRSSLALVGRRVRQLRREHRLSQEELAQRLRLHPQDLARMERGEYRVGLDTLRDLMAVFEVGIGELLEGTTSS